MAIILALYNAMMTKSHAVARAEITSAPLAEAGLDTGARNDDAMKERGRRMEISVCVHKGGVLVNNHVAGGKTVKRREETHPEQHHFAR